MARHIGIVAVSPEGSALCYRQIFRAAKKLTGDTGHPPVSLHNEPFERYIDALMRSDWHALAELLARSAKILAASGAEFCITPDNVMHHAVHLAEHLSPIPWLTMTELVADTVSRDGRKTVGLIGTKLVMNGSIYQTHLGLRGVQMLIPDEHDANDVDSIIFRELVYGITNPASQKRMLGVIEELGRRGCDSIILGCTEAPLLISADNSTLPVYDSTCILADGAVRRALGVELGSLDAGGSTGRPQPTV